MIDNDNDRTWLRAWFGWGKKAACTTMSWYRSLRFLTYRSQSSPPTTSHGSVVDVDDIAVDISETSCYIVKTPDKTFEAPSELSEA